VNETEFNAHLFLVVFSTLALTLG